MKVGFDSKIKKQVVVIGGGTAGFPAAVASARNGANTLLVERFQYLGGTMTGGLMLDLHTMRIHKDIRAVTSANAFQEVGYQSKQVIRGMSMEIHDRLIDMGAAYGRKGEAASKVVFDGEAMKFLADQMVAAAGVDVWLQSLVTDVIREDKTVKGVVVENKSGRHLIEADVFVDASGDADVACLAGAPYEKGRKEDGRTMPMSLVFIMDNVAIGRTIEYLKQNPSSAHMGVMERCEQLYKEGKPFSLGGFPSEIQKAHENGDFPLAVGAENPVPLFALTTMLRMGAGVVHRQTFHTVDMAYGLDASNARDLTAALFGARKQVTVIVNFMKKYIPGFENAYLLQTADQLGIRETRRIVGDYVMTKDDVLEARKFEDKIAQGGRAINVHNEVGGGKGQLMGGRKWLEVSGDEPYDVPYRSLLPSGVEGLLVAGRCISVDHMALGSLRGQPMCIATGEAAGTAAALAVRQGATPRQVEIRRLQQMLMSQGVELGQNV